MNSYSIRKRVFESPNIWPGFVDILATLLIVIIFVLMVFTVSQFYLSDAVVGRDKALEKLRIQIQELSKILSTTEKDLVTSEKDLETETKKGIELSSKLEQSEGLLAKRDQAVDNLTTQIGKLREELQIVALALEKYEDETITDIDTASLGERINMALAKRVDQLKNLNTDLANLNNQLLVANEELDIKDVELKMQIQELMNLNTDLANLNNQLLKLNEELDIKDVELLKRFEEIKEKNLKLSKLNVNLIEKDQTIVSLREKMLKLNDILTLSEEEKIKQEAKIISLTQQVEESETQISKSESSTQSAIEEVAHLSSELTKINNEIEILNAALEASERDRLTKELKIEVLGERLNKALTSQVIKLQEYRSEFFGRLKQILGNREDIRIVGDRFIFESELLFDSGSATLQEDGKYKMLEIAQTLKGITDEIPSDINWIVQVEGHTDNRPINTYLYPSNWELSTARANSVLKLLLNVGFKANQLAAAGYGEYYPIATSNSENDLRQNRRIELKLTTR